MKELCRIYYFHLLIVEFESLTLEILKCIKPAILEEG